MTTRRANVPATVSAKSGYADPTTIELKKKVVKGLHLDFGFEVQSLKAWNAALEKGPQVGSAHHPEANASFRVKRRAQQVFWRLKVFAS